MNWAGEACSEPGTSKTPSGCVPISRSTAGIRHEFTTGWNEVSGRAANYITDGTGSAADRAANFEFGVYAEQREEAVRAQHRAGMGSVRKRQDRGPRGIRHLLFADRRSQLSAEFAASGQWRGFLCGRAVAAASGDAGRAASAIVRSRAFRRPARLMRRRGSSPTRKLRPSRNGISRSSSS